MRRRLSDRRAGCKLYGSDVDVVQIILVAASDGHFAFGYEA